MPAYLTNIIIMKYLLQLWASLTGLPAKIKDFFTTSKPLLAPIRRHITKKNSHRISRREYSLKRPSTHYKLLSSTKRLLPTHLPSTALRFMKTNRSSRFKSPRENGEIREIEQKRQEKEFEMQILPSTPSFTYADGHDISLIENITEEQQSDVSVREINKIFEGAPPLRNKGSTLLSSPSTYFNPYGLFPSSASNEEHWADGNGQLRENVAIRRYNFF